MFFVLLFLVLLVVSKIEVYVIPHTHIDQGWLNTIDGYRSTVHHILNQVTDQMKKGADRTFNWGEVYYFKSWFTSIDADKQKYVRHLIEQGRFAFVHNGWVENDEACPTFTAIVDQLTYGIQYLRKEFGIEPRIAWEIDPFGHDRRMIDALSDMGFEAIVLNRVHFKIKDMMRTQGLYEFLWESGEKRIFCHTLFKHYSAPRTFDFEASSSRITNQNLKSRSQNLMGHFRNMKNSHLTNHILVPLGDDFKFQRANVQYENWDKLIKYINDEHGDEFNVRYSTALEYLDNILKEKELPKFPVVTHDFFPYMDHDDAWWSGFYTTHPLMKHRIREAEGWLHHGEVAASLEMGLSLQASQDVVANREKVLIQNREEVGVAQHHDYITGTSKRHVINDYIKRMSDSTMRARGLVEDVITNIYNKEQESSKKRKSRFYLGDDLFDLRIGGTKVEDILTEGTKKNFVLFNSVLSKRLELVEIITNSPNVKIRAFLPDSKKQPTEIRDIQVVPRVFRHGGEFRENEDHPTYLVYFHIPLHPLSITRFDVEVLPKSDVHPTSVQNMLCQARASTKASLARFGELDTNDKTDGQFFHHYVGGEVEKKFAIENEHYRVELELNDENEENTYVFRIMDHKTSITHTTKDEIFNFFQTSKSGAYLFRPNGWPQKYKDVPIENIFLTHGDVISQMTITTKRYVIRLTLPRHIHTNFDDETYLSNGRFIRAEVHIGELPGNQEIVFRLPLSSNAEDTSDLPLLYDYDGLYFRNRDYNANFGRHPVAGKFFPSPQGGTLRNKKSQVTVLNSASQAVGAKHGEDGKKEDEIMFLIHRRLMTDDFRGMSQANNDNTHLDTLFYIRYDDPEMETEKFSEIQKASEGLARKSTLFVFEGNENDGEENLQKYFYPIPNDNGEHFYDKYLSLMNFEVIDTKKSTIGLRLHNMGYGKEQFADIERIFGNGKWEKLEDSGLSYNSPQEVLQMKKTVNERYPREEEYTYMSIHEGKVTWNAREARDRAGLFVGQGISNEEPYFDVDSLIKSRGEKEAKSLVRPSEIRTWKIKGLMFDKNKCFSPQFSESSTTKDTKKKLNEDEEYEDVKILTKKPVKREFEDKRPKKEDEKTKVQKEDDEKIPIEHQKPPYEEDEEIVSEREIILFEVKKGGSKFSGRLIFFYFVVLVIGLVFVAWVYDRAKKNRRSRISSSSSSGRGEGILPFYNSNSQKKASVNVRVKQSGRWRKEKN